MKIGILSDIHGNHYALDKVLDDAKKMGVEKLFITGDFVGYYYNPKKVFELLETWDYVAVKGNHEVYLQESIQDQEFLKKITSQYGHGIQEAISSLSTEQKHALSNLPLSVLLEIDGITFHLFHGSPVSEDDYIYPTSSNDVLYKHFSKLSSDVFIGGHTHHACIFQIQAKLLINPGSVGQSRTNGGIAFWGIYNTENKSYSQRSTAYEVQSLLEEVQKYDSDINYLKDVLKR